ncbi:unnamed protein product [Cochlearia groenlandica]
MTGSSSSSIQSSSRHSVNGLAEACWCGGSVVTFTSKTNENPNRRFHICVYGQERKAEKHLFKWVDEAMLEEIKIIEAKHVDFVKKVEAMQGNIEEWFEKMESETEVKITNKVKTEVKITLLKIAITIVGLGSFVWVCGRFLF